MKKIIYLLVLSVLLVGCGSTEEDSNTIMDSFIKAFESEGVKVDAEEKPMFEMIGAKDGVIFYNDENVVKIYEFEDKEAIIKAEEALPVVKDWDRNGLFVLETSDAKSIEIFNKVK